MRQSAYRNTKNTTDYSEEYTHRNNKRKRNAHRKDRRSVKRTLAEYTD